MIELELWIVFLSLWKPVRRDDSESESAAESAAVLIMMSAHDCSALALYYAWTAGLHECRGCTRVVARASLGCVCV